MDIKIAAFSLDIVWADPNRNLLTVSQALAIMPEDIDLVVLPEMFTTGFITDESSVNRLAENWAVSPTLNFLKTKAKERNIAICASFLVRDENGIPRNRCVFVEPSGEITVYDKHHLFSPSDESRLLEHGTIPSPVVRFRSWNFAMSVCYDIRFPAWNRNLDYKYDVLLVPANWPASRGYLWEHLLIGRAIENQAYVVGANRSGMDDFGDYDNLSFIFDYVGKPIGKTITIGNDDSISFSLVVAELSHANIEKLHRHFPVAKDADRFRFI